MHGEFGDAAKVLSDAVSGKGGINFERIVALLSTDGGKKILSALLSDGGERIKNAARGAKDGKMDGISEIIAMIASTEEGRNLLDEMMKGNSR